MPTGESSTFHEYHHLNHDEEFVAIKGQAKTLKNRFVELEQDALKVETAASKIKYIPKRFVVSQLTL
jgi:hypothetical protein